MRTADFLLFALKKVILNFVRNHVDTDHALRNSFYFIQDVLITDNQMFCLKHETDLVGLDSAKVWQLNQGYKNNRQDGRGAI